MHESRIRFTGHTDAIRFVQAVGEQCSSDDVAEAKRQSECVLIKTRFPIALMEELMTLVRAHKGRVDYSDKDRSIASWA